MLFYIISHEQSIKSCFKFYKPRLQVRRKLFLDQFLFRSSCFCNEKRSYFMNKKSAHNGYVVSSLLKITYLLTYLLIIFLVLKPSHYLKIVLFIALFNLVIIRSGGFYNIFCIIFQSRFNIITI